MAKCSNCERDHETPALVVHLRGAAVADICDNCLQGVLTMKVVLKRDATDKPFAFEQYLPVESEKN